MLSSWLRNLRATALHCTALYCVTQATLVVSALKLLATTLSFDFTQSFSEECSDDLITVQLPSSWRNGMHCRCSSYLSEFARV